ncbi:MAG: TRAP transporter substrate-binding protein DctP [Thermodesulfobacteriota bacterium]
MTGFKHSVKTTFALAVIAFFLVWVPAQLSAGTTTIKAVTFLPENNCFCDPFWMFKEKLEKASQGEVEIVYAGGPEAIPSFEQIEAVTGGMVDMSLVPAAFYVPQLPVVDAMKLSKLAPWEERERGVYDFFNRLHQERLNAYYLGRFTPNLPFHLYVNQKIDKPDLSGLKIRVTPVYKPFVEELGAVAVTTSPGEVYTALERGVVEGYGWPATKISDFGWHEVTEYVIDPGFYQVDVGIVINLDFWNSLPDDLKKVFNEVAKEVEREAADHYARLIEEERDFIVANGVEVIEFTGEDRETYLKTAYEVGWEDVLKKSPENGARIKELLGQ